MNAMCKDINLAQAQTQQMDEQKVTTEQMTALKALTDTNMKISEAKGVLYKLQETETEYLIEREKKALSRIHQTIEDSRHLLDESKRNYEEIQELYRTAGTFLETVNKTYDSFQEIVKDFSERNQAWETNIGRQQDEIADQRKEIKADQVRIKNDQKSLESKGKLLENTRIHLESRQGTLEASYKIEKELWTKLSK